METVNSIQGALLPLILVTPLTIFVCFLLIKIFSIERDKPLKDSFYIALLFIGVSLLASILSMYGSFILEIVAYGFIMTELIRYYLKTNLLKSFSICAAIKVFPAILGGLMAVLALNAVN